MIDESAPKYRSSIRTYEPHPCTVWTVKDVHGRNNARWEALMFEKWLNKEHGKGNLKPGKHYSRAEKEDLKLQYQEEWTFFLARQRIKRGNEL
jgi:hypothetical protein